MCTFIRSAITCVFLSRSKLLTLIDTIGTSTGSKMPATDACNDASLPADHNYFTENIRADSVVSTLPTEGYYIFDVRPMIDRPLNSVSQSMISVNLWSSLTDIPGTRHNPGTVHILSDPFI